MVAAGSGRRPAAITGAGPAVAAAALAATLGLAAACWVVSVWQMSGMDMGVATRLGSFALEASELALLKLLNEQPAISPKDTGSARSRARAAPSSRRCTSFSTLLPCLVPQ